MIVVFGSIIVDHLFRVPALPRPGETALGERFSVMPGGKGANQALAAARAGAAVRLVGAVGRDHLAELALENLVRSGVDVGGVRAVDMPTGAAAIGVADDGGNQILAAAGANLAVAADWLAGRLEPGDMLVVQRELRQRETELAIGRARSAGCRVVLNLAPALEIDPDAVRAVDWLVVNESEAETLAASVRALGADAASLARALGVATVVTLGERGAQSCWQGKVWRTPALDVPVADTTGAGDAFVGAMAAALLAGLEPAAAVRRGCVAGSLACRSLGAQAALPDAAAIEAGLALLGPDVPAP